jgi:hypothetical protein
MFYNLLINCEKKIQMQDDNFQVFLGAGKKKCTSE